MRNVALVGAATTSLLMALPNLAGAAEGDAPVLNAAARGELEGLCGDLIESIVVGRSELMAYEGCRAEFLPDDERLVVEFVGVDVLAPAMGVALGAHDISAAQAADLEVLGSLGINADEFADVHTTQVGSESRSTDGAHMGRWYHGTKTFVQRAILGVDVGRSRAVVSRSLDGRLAAIAITWPTFSSTTAVVDGTARGPHDAGDASMMLGVEEADIVAVRPLLVTEMADRAGVESAVILTEVIHLVDGANGVRRPTATYFFEGEQVDPEGLR